MNYDFSASDKLLVAKYSISLIRSELNLAIPCNANASAYIVNAIPCNANASAYIVNASACIVNASAALLMYPDTMPMHSKGMLMRSPALKTLRFYAKLY